MRNTSTAILSLVLSSFLSSAYGQYGGGYAPPRPSPAPPAPAQPPSSVPGQNPIDQEVRKYEEDTARPPAPSEPAIKKDEESKRVDCKPPEKSWVTRLAPADRAAVEEGLGYALAPMTAKVKWIGSTATKSTPELVGKVLIIQSIDAGTTAPTVIDRIVAALGPMPVGDDVIVIGVQVPNKLESAIKRLGKFNSKANLCVDESGEWCDALGMYKKPVNLVVDRNGAIRYAGLTEKGAAAAAKVLLAEPAHIVKVAQRPAPAASATATDVVFPTFTEPLLNCTDLRGKSSPDLLVEAWVTKKPDISGKIVIVDFFATWCGPCMAAREHMNGIAKAYAATAVIVGLSDEKSAAFDDGLKRRKLKEKDFNYSIALDPAGRMKNGFGVGAIPNIAIISSDGIVRWQGHPTNLTPAVLDPIVAANAQLPSPGGKKATTGRGWAK